MNFAETFIRRPVATTLLVLSILIFGIMGYQLLPVSDLPTVDFPTIQVNANLPGASPETMAASVATPLEKQFSTIAGVTSISSSNSQGNTSITLQFDLSRSIDAAAQDVQSMIARAQRQLPPGMPSPPSFQKVNPAADPILFLALTTRTLPLSQLSEYGETLLAQRNPALNPTILSGDIGAARTHHRDVYVRSGLAGKQRLDFGQRCLQVLLNVIAERLQWRDVQNLSAIPEFSRERLPHQPVNAGEECRKSLS